MDRRKLREELLEATEIGDEAGAEEEARAPIDDYVAREGATTGARARIIRYTTSSTRLVLVGEVFEPRKPD